MSTYNDFYNTQQFDPAYEPINEVSFSNQRESQIRVVSLIISPTGEYNQQYLRPWVTVADPTSMNTVAEAVQRTFYDHKQRIENGQAKPGANYRITPELLAGASGSFIKPSEVWESKIGFNKGGWGTQVCRFMMNIEVKSSQTIEPRQYCIIGHTDVMGLTASGHIAPEMVMTINSMFETRDVVEAVGYATQRRRILVKCHQILVNDNYQGPGHLPSSIHRMRPEDVLQSIHIANVADLNGANTKVIDARSTNSTIPSLSSYQNINPNAYMSRVLSGITDGKDQAHRLNRPSEAYDLGAAQVAEGNHYRDPFISAISSFNHNAGTNQFTVRDLLRIDPNATSDGICFVQWRERPTQVNQPFAGADMHIAGSTNDWHANDWATQLATQIANVIPSLMTDLGVRRCQVYATNKQIAKFLSVTGCEGLIPNVDMTPQAMQLERMIDLQVINEVEHARYEVSITADLMGEIWISLDLEGVRERKEYVVPAYASSRTSPVVTRNVNNLMNVASNFSALQAHMFPEQQQFRSNSPIITQPETQFWGPSVSPYGQAPAASQHQPYPTSTPSTSYGNPYSVK